MKKFALLQILLLTFVVGINAAWEKVPSKTFGWLRTIEFSDASNGWIGGNKGILLRSTDGGTTWALAKSFTKDTIRDIHFANGIEGWALCERNIFNLGDRHPSYIMRTVDGGKTWEKIEFDDSRRSRITRLVFASNGNGLAIGEMGTMFGLDDRARWKKQGSPTAFLMNDGAFADNFRAALVGGGGTILFTEDAGVSWMPARVAGKPKAMLQAIHFASDRMGWAVGASGKIVRTSNGGRFWREQKSGTKAKLNGVHFSDTRKGWAIGEKGTILRTRTGGNSWFFERSRTRNGLEDIDSNKGTVWAVGFGGTILKN